MAAPTAFELFAFWWPSATFRVRVALNLKGLAAHERIVNLEAGEQRSNRVIAACDAHDAFARAAPLQQAGAPVV